MDAAESHLAAVLAAAERKDAAAAATATAHLLNESPSADDVHRVVDEAVLLASRDFLRMAARLAIQCDMSPSMRVTVAWRFALAGHGEEAMAVLFADPRMSADPRLLRRSVLVLREVRARGPGASLAVRQARALLRRMVAQAEPPFVDSPHGFAGDPAAAPCLLGPPARLDAAAGLPPALRSEAAAALEGFARLARSAPPPRVRLLANVFVNREGEVWDEQGRLLRAGNRGLQPESRRAGASATGIDEAALATESHRNIFHWLVEWFPALAWRLDMAAGGMPVLLRDDAPPFVHESLALAAAGPLDTVAVGEAIFVRRLHVVEPRRTTLARAELVGPSLRRLRERALAAAPGAGGRPVYISRSDTPRRPMENEAALEAALAARGFDIVAMSALPLAEQVARIDRAGLVVGAHGAGLGLLAAARPGLRVAEIVPAVRGDMAIRMSMAEVSRMTGHIHHLWIERMPAGTGGRWSASLDPFLALVDRLRGGGVEG